jgi:SAM-dependent methyltransferase
MSTIDRSINELYCNKVYRNLGNHAVLALVPPDARRVLDVGCGAGDNARILRQRNCQVWGVTLSEAEAEAAREVCEGVCVGNVETGDLDLPVGHFDVILLSSVLEHLIDPNRALTRLAAHLRVGGIVLVAVPNMANYRLRLRFLWGDWHREPQGALDHTHFHFWSYETIDEAFRNTPLQITKKVPGDPAIPLWPLRRLLPPASLRWLDVLGGKLRPNLFAGQCLVVAQRVI